MYNITIFDHIGRKVFEDNNVSGKVNISCENFSSGLYFVEAKNKTKFVTRKIIKE
ncbi:MAG: T9SS type A sorting domain-containing protein [Bacteroidetes bacterium]|nr:T9SS type A sorting domain-containing protein [Bacteroidota bacterium]